jgi:Rod binding domain-containing protein
MNIAPTNLSSLVSPTLGALPPTENKASGSDQLKAASQEFEGLMLSLLLKEMRNSLDQDGEGGLFAGEKSDTLGSLFDMYMGTHMASSSSLGIASAMQSYLAIQANAPDRLVGAADTRPTQENPPRNDDPEHASAEK